MKEREVHSRARADLAIVIEAKQAWLKGNLSAKQLKSAFGQCDYRLQIVAKQSDEFDALAEVCCAAEWLEENPIGGDEPGMAERYAMERWEMHCAASTLG